MADDAESWLLDCWQRVVRSHCRKPFLEAARVGSGQMKKSGFCSLDCYTKYYEFDFRERLRRFVDPSGTSK